MITLTVLLLFQAQAFQTIPYFDPLNRSPSTYEEFAAARIDAPFQAQVAEGAVRLNPRTLEPLDPGVSGSYSRLVLVLANASLYPAIQPELAVYTSDLSFEGYSSKVISVAGGRAADLKQILLAHRDSGLVGAVMVGDLPVAWWSDGSHGEDYPLDLFFTALNGTFTDANSDGRYDNYSGSIVPTIWLGRIYASRMAYAAEEYLVKSYFQRNHLYRTGQLPVPARGLAYNEVDWYPNNHGMNALFSDVTVVNDENTTTARHYKTTLGQGFGFVHLVSHSSPWVNTFFLAGDVPGGGSVFNFEIPALQPNAAFYFLNACMCGRFTERDNLGNWYLFSGPWSMGVIASAQLMYGVSDLSGLYTPLGRDSCFGSAFLAWHRSNYPSFMGTCLLGDPTLRVRRTDPPLARIAPAPQRAATPLDWTTYAVDTSNFVNGRPVIGYSQGRIRIVFDSGRIVRSDNYLSSFDGTGFTRPESIAWHDYYDMFSSVATDAAGRFWVVWQSFRDYDQGYDHFQLFSSHFYNNAWSAVQRVGALAGYHDVQPAVASGTDNVVWCAFKSWRNGQGDIWVSNETNGGSWSAPIRLTTDSLDQIDPCVVVDNANHPWVFWQSQVGGRFRIQGRTHNGTWQPVFDIDTTGNAGPPQAAVDARGDIWVIWHSRQGAQGHIYYARRSDSAWTAPQPVTSGSTDDYLPDICSGPDTTVCACWQSDSGPGTPSNIYWAINGAHVWTVPYRITSDNAHAYDATITTDTSRNVWVAWASDLRGYWNIYAAEMPYEPSAVAGARPRACPPQFAVAPNPFSRTVSFIGPGEFSVDVFSLDGRMVTRLPVRAGRTDWAPGKLPHGVYIARVAGKQGNATVKLAYTD